MTTAETDPVRCHTGRSRVQFTQGSGSGSLVDGGQSELVLLRIEHLRVGNALEDADPFSRPFQR